ncbi:DUF4453 domain-containing protein [Tropicimonas aquimaris]|uniref:DUF4453 domain-containing protein n=1 Tax=Tropicimonas aquimaris TaxID=914152 RepID=A0ABW3IP63_9RHOB
MSLRRVFLAAFLTLASPAGADVWPYGQTECNQLWFMRNLIMDRAGYCFGTALGQALYDNGDCLGKEVALAAPQSRQVAAIQGLERQIGCKVNTGSTYLELPLMEHYRRLSDMPLPDNGASACLNWIGPTVPLMSGYARGARQLASIERGDRIGFGYIPEGSWVAVVLSKGAAGGSEVLGWFDSGPLNLETACSGWAG